MKFIKLLAKLSLIGLTITLGLQLPNSQGELALANWADRESQPGMPPAQATGGPTIWRARLVEVVPNAVLGGGAILRVRVQDSPGVLIEVQQINTILTNTTGTKPEHGPDVAEFAPLPPGRWVVSAPSLGVSLAVQTDDRSLFVVEFAQIPAAQATAEAQGAATPTPLGGVLWEGVQTSVIEGPSFAGALLRVKVAGQSGLPVDLSTFTDFIGQGITGSKTEYPADEVEFAALAPGSYIIAPQGLNAQLTIELAVNTTVFVEFRAAPTPPPPPPTATATRVLPTATPRPTSTPTPTATPLMDWLALVAERHPIESATNQLVVEIDNLPNQTLTISGGDPLREIDCTANQQIEAGLYACEITDLLPGRYRVIWPQEDLMVPLEVSSGQRVVVAFRQMFAPAETTVWRASITQNSNTALPTSLSESEVTVQVADRVGQVVSLVNSRRQRRFCETGTNGTCQFQRLGAGVYIVEPANIATQIAFYLNGQGQIRIVFDEFPTEPPNGLPQATPVLGHGAIPKPTATPTITPSPTLAPATSTSRPTTPRPTATVTPIPSPSQTPTPALAWFGTLAESYAHPGQTLVVRAPLAGHPVILQSGSWQAENLTGSKPELGEGAAEFAGLAPGEYIVTLVGLAEMRVTLPSDTFSLVQFVYGPAPTATPTLQPGQWTAAIIETTSGNEPGGGAWSILTIEIGGVNGLPVQISTDGFQTECITGSKPELGDGVCQIGGLWPGTFHVQPAGLPISIDVPLDGRGAARVAFWQQ